MLALPHWVSLRRVVHIALYSYRFSTYISHVVEEACAFFRLEVEGRGSYTITVSLGEALTEIRNEEVSEGRHSALRRCIIRVLAGEDGFEKHSCL